MTNWVTAAIEYDPTTLTPLFQGTGAGNGGHLGMYVSPSTPSSWIDGWGIYGGGSEVRGSGYGLTDTAGTVPANTTSPGFSAVSGDVGISGTYDVSRYIGLPADQSLDVKGYFNYGQDNIRVATGPALGPLIVGNAGSLNGNTYTFGASALYRFGTSYIVGAGSYNFGSAHETDNVSSSTGSFTDSGYMVDGRLGHVFVLSNTTGVPVGTAAPAKAASGTIVGLDLSGHVGYSDNRSDNFTDSTGFMFGTGEARSGDFGARFRVFSGTSADGLIWMPYFSATVDQLFDVSNTFGIPNQAAMPGGDLLNFNVSKTFLGGDVGLDVRGPSGWTIGAKGFIDGSNDTTIAGGMAYVKIPFNYGPVAARY